MIQLSNISNRSDWYVNSNVITSGDGSINSPIKTAEELSEILCPNGMRLNFLQQTNIHLAGTLTDLVLNVSFSKTNILKITSDTTISDPITITNVIQTNSTSKTRGKLSITGGTVSVGQRIKVISGNAISSISYCNGVIDDTTIYVKPFFRSSDSSLVFPSSGDTIVVETLTTNLNRLEMHCSVAAEAGGNSPTCIISNMILPGIWAITTGMFLSLENCELPSASQSMANNGLLVKNCKIGTDSDAHTFNGTFFEFSGCFIGLVNFTGVGNSQIKAACCMQGGAFYLNAPSYTTQTGFFSVKVLADLEIENGESIYTFVKCGPGCQFITNANIWSAADSNPYGIGFLMSNGSYGYKAAAANISFPTLVNVNAGGIIKSFADIPFTIPNANCGFVLN